jgi:hypothetical protein
LIAEQSSTGNIPEAIATWSSEELRKQIAAAEASGTYTPSGNVLPTNTATNLNSLLGSGKWMWWVAGGLAAVAILVGISGGSAARVYMAR